MKRLVAVLALLSAGSAFAGVDDLADPDPRVRRKAAIEIGKAGSATDTTVALLVEALEDDSPEVRTAALVALASLGEAGVPHLEPRLAAAATRADTRKAIHGAGPRAVPLLLALLRSSHWRVRAIACEHLGGLGKGRHALASLLVDPAAAVRLAVVDAVAKIGGEGIVEILARALEDRHAVVRGRALSAIAAIEVESEARTAILVRAAESENWRVRLIALAALGGAGPEDVLRKALDDPREEVRVQVAMRLFDRGKREAAIGDVLLGRLRAIHVNSPARPFRRGHRNLRAFGGRGSVSGLRLPPVPKDEDVARALVGLAPATVPGLVKGLGVEDEYTRWNAILLIHRIGGEHREHLVPVLGGRYEPDRVMVAVLLAPLPEHRDAAAAILVRAYVEARLADGVIDEDPVIRDPGPWRISDDEVAKATKLLGKAALPILNAQLESLGPKPEPEEGSVLRPTPDGTRRKILTKLIREFSE